MIVFVSRVWAADCAPLDEVDLRALVDEAKAAVDRDDLVGFADARRTLLRDLPCLEGPLPTDAWARFLLDEAVVAHALGEQWEAPLDTALSLDPALPRGDLPPELRDHVPAPRGTGAAVPPGLWVDGRPITSVPDPAGLHVVQRSDDGVWITRVLRDAPLPPEWSPAVEAVPVGAPEARRGRGSAALIATGLVALAAGAGLGAGTWAARGAVTDPGAAEGLVLANVAGWGLAGVGVVVGAVGLGVPSGDRRVAVTVGGTF